MQWSFHGKDSRKVVIITNNPQFSSADYTLLKSGIDKARDYYAHSVDYNVRYGDGNPFNPECNISKAVDNAFEKHAEKVGFIGEA